MVAITARTSGHKVSRAALLASSRAVAGPISAIQALLIVTSRPIPTEIRVSRPDGSGARVEPEPHAPRSTGARAALRPDRPGGRAAGCDDEGRGRPRIGQPGHRAHSASARLDRALADGLRRRRRPGCACVTSWCARYLCAPTKQSAARRRLSRGTCRQFARLLGWRSTARCTSGAAPAATRFTPRLRARPKPLRAPQGRAPGNDRAPWPPWRRAHRRRA